MVATPLPPLEMFTGNGQKEGPLIGAFLMFGVDLNVEVNDDANSVWVLLK